MSVLASALCGVCQPHLAGAWHRPAAKLPAGVAFGTETARLEAIGTGMA